MRNDNEKANGSAPCVSGSIAPYAYWRTFGRPDYDIVRRLQLTCMLGAVSTTDMLWRRALEGDAASSVAIAMRIRRPTIITYPIDLRMSVLLNAALLGDVACALVMEKLLSKMPLQEDERERLAFSWSDRRLRSPPLAPSGVIDPERPA